MLYVFHVDTGTMMTFEMSLALESVNHLREHIQKTCNIPCDKQVLLVSGGESLDPESRVCSYSAGTDTNPIFLFSKSVIESTTRPSANVEYESDAEFLEKVEEATKDLPSDYATVVHRTQLAQRFYELAKEQAKICKKLVHDQHLQQQGWSAVVANLDDITMEFKKRADLCEKQFSDYLNEHESYLKFLQSFQEDLQILSRIPLLPVLLENEKLIENTLSAVVSSRSESASEHSDDSKRNITLLEWISASDNKNSMDQLYELCLRGLQQFDNNVYNTIRVEIQAALDHAGKPDMKEVRGIGDRLFGLEQLMVEAKRYVQEQGDLAQSLLQNQNRAGNLRDKSVLPDLCASHRKQLLVMTKNHKQLCDIRRRCTNAKEELISNLYYRLKWVMFVENTILETSHRLFIYHENLKRLRKHLEVLQQIHLAPAVYLTAVAEVVRRKTFSQAFLVWASELACHLLTIHNNEVTRRKDFHSQFEGHFLNSLFPGMDDLPPTFATQAPSVFDSSLPNVTMDDMQVLREALPEMSDNLVVPDLSIILKFFDCKSDGKFDKEENIAGVDDLVQAVEDMRLSANNEQILLKAVENESCVMAPSLPHLKDLDRGCESETDTEEFEKVCQSPLDIHFDKDIPSPRTKTQDVATLTEVGERGQLPPKKPPRVFQKLQHSSVQSQQIPVDTSTSPFNFSAHGQRTFSYSGSQSNTTDSFTNIKNPSLDSMDDFSSLKNLPVTMESCYNSHHHQQQQQQQQMQIRACNVDITVSIEGDGDEMSNGSVNLPRSKSASPHTPSSFRDVHLNEQLSPTSPVQVHQQVGAEFVTDEYYIDESLPSSLSMEAAGGGQCQGEFAKQLDTANNVVALLQDSLQTSRTEYDKLRVVLNKLTEIISEALPNFKQELSLLKDFASKEAEEFAKNYGCLTKSLTEMNLERCLQDSAELIIYKNDLEVKTEELKCLREENISLETRIENCAKENTNLRDEMDKLKTNSERKSMELSRNLERIEEEKERMIKELKETLSREHRAEIDNLRSRFKLMMDQSPTDMNQDKLDQFREDFKNKKAEAVESAVLEERIKWENVLKETIEKITKEKDEEKQLIIKENEQKEHLLSTLKLELGMLKENQNENDSITETKKTDEMVASVGLFEGRIDAATSPVRHQDKLTKSQISLIKSGKFSLNSCVVGDIVLVLWEPAHENYKILQESSTMYFLHSDCLELLGLRKCDIDEQKPYCVGQVTNKEYCHARKAQNRYKVPIGTKFYRVSVKPFNLEAARSFEATTSRHQSHQMSESQPAALPSTIEHQYKQGTPSSTSQSTLSRSKSTMESSIVTGCSSTTVDTSQNELLSSNRNQTFSYFLNDTWIVGSPWIVENS